MIEDAQKEGKTVHFDTLVDLWNFKKSRIGQEIPDVFIAIRIAAKDHSGSYAVFTEQGSSASHMTAAKVSDVIARLPDCAGEASDAFSAYTQVKMKDASAVVRLTEAGMSTNLDTHTTISKLQIMGQDDRSCGSTGQKLVRTSTSRVIVETQTRRCSVGRRMGKYQDANACRCIEKVAYVHQFTLVLSKWRQKKEA